MKIKVRTQKVYICEDGQEFTDPNIARQHTINLGIKKLVEENFRGEEIPPEYITISPDDIIISPDYITNFIINNYYAICSLSSGSMEKE